MAIEVTPNHHSIVFTRKGSFITSIPIRRRIQTTDPNGKLLWSGVNMRPGEILDLVVRLELSVNSDRPGSLFQKIDDEVKRFYVPRSIVTKSHETRLKSFKNRRKQGRGHLSREAGGRPPGAGRARMPCRAAAVAGARRVRDGVTLLQRPRST